MQIRKCLDFIHETERQSFGNFQNVLGVYAWLKVTKMLNYQVI